LESDGDIAQIRAVAEPVCNRGDVMAQESLRAYQDPRARRVKYAIRAWKLALPETEYSILVGPIEPVGEPATLEPFDEIQFLRWTSNSGDTWALVVRCDSLFLITQDNFAHSTVRALR
jgi:hypothetical protein